jgi:hypothetical protein
MHTPIKGEQPKHSTDQSSSGLEVVLSFGARAAATANEKECWEREGNSVTIFRFVLMFVCRGHVSREKFRTRERKTPGHDARKKNSGQFRKSEQ